MATLNVAPGISFTYRYGNDGDGEFTEGNFFDNESNNTLGVLLKVTRATRSDAVDSIQRYAKIIGEHL